MFGILRNDFSLIILENSFLLLLLFNYNIYVLNSEIIIFCENILKPFRFVLIDNWPNGINVLKYLEKIYIK